jgi:hypothetical protein
MIAISTLPIDLSAPSCRGFLGAQHPSEYQLGAEDHLRSGEVDQRRFELLTLTRASSAKPIYAAGQRSTFMTVDAGQSAFSEWVLTSTAADIR